MITITGLGPGDFDRIPASVRNLLLHPARRVILRTIHHPAAAQLAGRRHVETCDDLYQSLDRFEDVYDAIAARVLEAGRQGDVVYAVPGSPLLGELAVRRLLSSPSEVELIPAESFLDAVLVEVGYDPLDRGLQVLDGHHLPAPLVLDKPTVVAHLDRPEVLADVAARIGRVLPEESRVVVVSGLGAADARVVETAPDRIDPTLAGYRTSLFLDTDPGGLVGAVTAMRRLRRECPWDREQTHQSLVKYLVEEANELIEAVARLDPDRPDWVDYARVEDELGDVLLSVLFHAAIAAEAGAFDIDDVAEALRQKLVRRHPHVFGEVEVADAAEVKRNWDAIKGEERGEDRDSAMDGVPEGMPALYRASKLQHRAAKLGFDWGSAGEVVPKIGEELEELASALDDPGRAEAELGDLLFSVVNLARHLGIDPEIALRRANLRFETRFRSVEASGGGERPDLDEMNRLWQEAKQAETQD